MANFQANFHTLITRRLELDEFIQDINKSVYEITGGDRFITFFICEYDVKARTLKYVNAGHNPPVIISANQMEFLRTGCVMLGPFSDIPEVKIGYAAIEDDEAVILAYTDGLTDIRNAEGNFFSEEMLSAFIKSHYTESVDRLNAKLMEYIDLFRGKETIPDDFTVLACKVYCPAK